MSEILRYKLNSKRRLPSGYTPVAYIKGTNACINTGIIPNDDTFSMYYEFGNIDEITDWNLIAGSSTSYGFCITKHESGIILYNEYTDDISCGINLTDKHFIHITKNKCYIDYNSYNTSVNSTISSCTYPTCLFASYVGLSSGSCKIYSCKIWKDNCLLRDLIPCYNGSEYGMFDLVTLIFFGNVNSSGSITGGPEVRALPYEYLQVEYIESTGSQYIDTGLIPTSEYVTEAYVQLESAGYYSAIFGCGQTYAILRNSYTQLLYCEFNGVGSSYTEVGFPTKEMYQVKLDGYNSKMVLDGVEVSIDKGANYQYNTLTIFKKDEPSFWTMKLYSFTVTNDSLERDMVPCYRRSDMKPGMYDLINDVFYTNSGTGEFILGPTVEESSRLLEYNQVSTFYNPYDSKTYTESDGSKWTRIFHHNNPNSLKLFNVNDFFNQCYYDEDRWSFMYAFNRVSSWEIMIKLKATSSSTEQKFRFVLSANPLTATSSATVTYNTASGYTTATSAKGPIVKIANDNAYLDSATDSWWGAFGICCDWWGCSIPGWNETRITTGYSDLYIRIPNDGVVSSDYIGLPSNIYYSGENPNGVYCNLPNGYLRVEYVEATGSQYIDSGVALDKTGYVMWADFLFTHTPGDESIMGFFDNETYYYCRMGGINNTGCTCSIDATSTLRLTGVSVATTQIDSNYRIFLFAKHRVASPFMVDSMAYAKIYEATITNNTEIRHFIPCVRTSDSVAGMYDLVTSTFYVPSGTLIAGPTISNNYNGSTYFNGNESIIVNKKLNVVNNTSPFSVSYWIYRTGNPTYNPHFELGDNSATGICIRNDHLERGDGTTNYDNVITNFKNDLNVWYHNVLTYDGATIKIYLNGVNIYSIAGPSSGLGTNSELMLGKFWGGYGQFNMYDFRIFTTALTNAEIKQIYLNK